MSHEYDEQQIDALVGINVFGSTFSLLGALFVITNYWMFVSLRKNFAFKIVYWIAVSDLILALSNLMGAPSSDSALCFLQAILQQFGQMSSVLWVACCSWTINHLTLLNRLPTRDEISKLWKKMHLFIWTFTIITVLLPLMTSSYGPSGGWCWIERTEVIDIVWRYICFYIPLWISIIYMIYVYVKVWKRLMSTDIEITDSDESGDELEVENVNDNNMSSGNIDGLNNTGDTNSTLNIEINSDRDIILKSEEKVVRKQNNTLQRMKYYPIILIICYFWATVRRIVDWATDYQTEFFLAILHTFFASIPGLLNAITYGLTKDVQQKDKVFINKMCGKNTGSNSHIQVSDYDNDEETEIMQQHGIDDEDDDQL